MDETVHQPEQKTSSMNPLIIVAVIAILAIGAYMMMTRTQTPTVQPESNEQTAPDSTSAGASAETIMAETATDVRIIDLEAGSFYYKPSTITVKKGEKVKIIMKSVDMMHDFNIDELGVKIPITKSGETSTVEFTAEQVGSFEYYCSVGQHRANGQIGTITVEE
jgi:nitrosocyanin